MAFTRSNTLAKKLAALITSAALGTTALVSLTFVATSTSVSPVHAAGLGGPVQLDGMDPVCHSGGESTGQYIAAVLKSLHDQATINGSDGSIAILGAGVSNACGESMDATDPSNFVDGQYLDDFSTPKPSWNLYSSATDVQNFFADLAAGTVNPKVIWMPDDWNRSNDVETAFTAHAEDIANFVNAGGGLFSNMGQYGWLSSLLPQAQYVGGGCNGGPALSIDGQNAFPTLTDTMVEACWHGSFWGSYTGLVSLVEWPYDALNTGATPTPMAAVAIGGSNVTMPTSFKLETDPPQAIPSDTVDVIASAIGLDGTIYAGVTVSFSISSGPHAGWTATATTGADGLAHASLTYIADGSDVIEASATVNGSAKTQTYTLDWAPAFTPVRFVDSVLGSMTQYTPYSNGVAADGRPAPTYAITAGALPAGLSLNGTTGAIAGTPTASGVFSFEITASNSAGSAFKTFTGSVTAGTAPAATAPVWTDTTLAALTLGMSFSDGVEASGTPTVTYAVTAGSLPAGLSLNISTGAITGTPTAAGPYSFEVTATTDAGSVSQTFSGSVATVSPTLDDSTVKDGVVGVAYSDGVTATATGAVTYAVTAGSLPAGLSLNSSTGAITGTPTVSGSFSFTVTATSANGSADVALTIAVVSMSFEPTKDINNVGSDNGSLDFSTAPAGSSISVTPPIATDKKTAGTAAIAGTSVVYTPSAGFSGYAKVTVTITVNGHSEDREYTFTVIPAPIAAGEYTQVPEKAATAWLNSPRAIGNTSVSWQTSPNAQSYEVWDMTGVSAMGVHSFSGKLLCRTTTTSCTLPMITGPSSALQVVAVGGDDLRSTVAIASYRPVTTANGVKALNSQFASDSYKLSPVMKAELKALAAQVKVAGYKRIYLTGNTDDRGPRWYNRYLGNKRAQAVKSYLTVLLPDVTITTVTKGSAEPVSNKKTKQARTLNRRVDVFLAV